MFDIGLGEEMDLSNKDGMILAKDINQLYCGDGIAKIAFTGPHQGEMREALTQLGVSNFLDKYLWEERDGKNLKEIITEALNNETQRKPNPFKSNLNLQVNLHDVTLNDMANRIAQSVDGFNGNIVRLTDELTALLQRLFYDRDQIDVRKVSSGFGPAGVIKVTAYSNISGNDNTVIVKYGDQKQIQREFGNWATYVKRSSGRHATIVLEHRCTPLLGAVVYSFAGSNPVYQIIDFAGFYQYNESDKIKEVIDKLVNVTCVNWYRNRGNGKSFSLTEDYIATLGLRDEVLLAALQTHYPRHVAQNVLIFPEIAGVTLPNPVYATHGKLVGKKHDEPTFRCWTHGDLNEHNILIDHGQVWLIDFYKTGEGHILRDFVKLETSVKLNLLSSGGLNERYQFEKALLSMNEFDDVDHLSYDAPDQAFVKAFEVCRKLRQVARDQVRPNSDFSEYEIGLLYNNLNALRFEPFDPLSRSHALMTAGMLCEKLGLKP
jgi:hypothetical protein